MSLVIASNQDSDKTTTTTSQSIFKPYSFRNALSSTMSLPKNAQIALKSAKFNLSKLRVCGVNTGCCVLETVLGLRRILKHNSVKIELALGACNDDYYRRKKSWQKEYVRSFEREKLEVPIFV